MVHVGKNAALLVVRILEKILLKRLWSITLRIIGKSRKEKIGFGPIRLMPEPLIT